MSNNNNNNHNNNNNNNNNNKYNWEMCRKYGIDCNDKMV